MLIQLLAVNVASIVISLGVAFYLIKKWTSVALLIQILNIGEQSLLVYQTVSWTTRDLSETAMICYRRVDIVLSLTLIYCVFLLDWQTASLYRALNPTLFSSKRLFLLVFVFSGLFFVSGLLSFGDAWQYCTATDDTLSWSQWFVLVPCLPLVCYDALQSSYLLFKLREFGRHKRAQTNVSDYQYTHAGALQLMILLTEIVAACGYVIGQYLEFMDREMMNHFVIAMIGIHGSLQVLLFVNLRDFTVGFLRQIHLNQSVVKHEHSNSKIKHSKTLYFS